MSLSGPPARRAATAARRHPDGLVAAHAQRRVPQRRRRPVHGRNGAPPHPTGSDAEPRRNRLYGMRPDHGGSLAPRAAGDLVRDPPPPAVEPPRPIDPRGARHGRSPCAWLVAAGQHGAASGGGPVRVPRPLARRRTLRHRRRSRRAPDLLQQRRTGRRPGRHHRALDRRRGPACLRERCRSPPT